MKNHNYTNIYDDLNPVDHEQQNYFLNMNI